MAIPAQGFLALLTAWLACLSVEAARSRQNDSPIAKVTDLLKEMLEKSKEDGMKDREVFAKFKCYCDTNIAEKEKSIAKSQKEISLLESEIDELQADTAKRSTENGELFALIADNEQARTTAQSIRDKENQAFQDEELDMEQAIGAMEQAIETLGAIGADQTAPKASALAVGVYQTQEFMNPDGTPSGLMSTKTFMSKGDATTSAKASLKRLSKSVKGALKAAASLLEPHQKKLIMSFIQMDAPFTGEYQAQSGEIMGILKNMEDTFKANLASATQKEKASAADFKVFDKEKTDNFDKMKESHEANEEVMGTNDETIATKKTALADAEKSVADDTDFLNQLTPVCEDKPSEYERRKTIRANEEAAVGQAISILNSDTAGGVFDKVDATDSGGTGPAFLQVSRKHSQHTSARMRIQAKLQRAAQRLKSLKIAKVAVLLEQENPFHKVEEEIREMIEVINKEEKADDEQKAWCDSEREEAWDTRARKIDEIKALKKKIDSLHDTVNNEETGLKQQVKDALVSLKVNRKNQKDTIKERSDENKVYQGVIINIVEAEKTLQKAIKVLKKYYEWLHAAQAPHHYEKKEGKDSGGGNIKRYPETSIEELEELCSEEPSCRGFNTNGWLKSKVDPEDKWYESDGSLYVKVYDKENTVGALMAKKTSAKKTSAKTSASAHAKEHSKEHSQEHVKAHVKAHSHLKRKEDPELPDTWEEESEIGNAGKATDVVSMIEYIYDKTVEEEHDEHDVEEANQHAFESEMSDLKSEEQSILDSITDLEDEIAEKENNIEESHTEREATELEQKNTERYIEEIKPGCDFIDENIETRKENRAAEIKSLNGALDAMEGTPAFKEAAAEEEREMYGSCADKCIGDGKKDSLDCKACMEGVTIPAYCALHKDTPGCEDQ